MKAFIIVLTFLFCMPIVAQEEGAFFNNQSQKIQFEKYSIRNDKTQSTIDELNKYDIKYYELNLNVSNLNTEISGDATIYAQVKTATLDTFYIELIDTLDVNSTYMIVDSVWVDSINANYTHENNLIKIIVSPLLPFGSYFYVNVFYHGDGRATPLTNYNGITNETAFNYSATYTYSEPFWSRMWFPCKQILTDKADSVKIILTTDSDCLAGSNGLLKSVTNLPDNKVRYEWASIHPVAYYLISFAVSQYSDYETYAHLINSEDSVLIQSYLFPNSPYLSNQLIAIDKTKENIKLFSELFGKYPFSDEKYGYCVQASPWGAMENQTMTTIGYAALDTAVSIIGSYRFWYSAHELGHSWFGDNVTCSTWQDIWVNEGFAEYCSYLALQYNISQNAADELMIDAQNTVKTLPGGSVYVPVEYANNESRIFDYRLSYKKGAAILHMIRFVVNNDSLFFQSMRNFETKFAGGTATGLGFKEVLDSTTGMDFTDFFNEWYFGQGYPIFNIYFYQNNDTLNFHSVQTTSSSVTPLFKIPVELKLFYAGGDTTITYIQNENDINFSLISHHQITQVAFDPDHWLVAKNIMHITAVPNNPSDIRTYSLSQNFPNPFNPVTKIKFQIAKSEPVKLIVYNVLGREIAALVNETKQPGNYEVEFDGGKITSGIYFYKLEAGSFKQVKKMILLK